MSAEQPDDAAADRAQARRVSATEPAALTIALAGNPNSGKTTIFNALTGARQHVGNYPGVTVEKKEGTASHHGRKIHVIDLPGTYSLTAYSVDEVVARNVLLEETPDAVVAVVDSSNLERNLYLVTQLMEMDVPLVLAFNMSDIAKNRGMAIDDAQLSKLFGVPIVPTVGHKGRGIDKLMDAVVAVATDPQAARQRQRSPTYGGEVEPHVQQLAEALAERCGPTRRARWTAVKLLENDEESVRQLRRSCPEHAESVLAEAEQLREHIQSVCGDVPEIILADRRYGYISGACTEAVHQTVEARHAASDKIDRVLTNRWLGLPIFIGLMYLVFYLTFTLGEWPMGWLEFGIGWLGETFSGLWPKASDSILRSLLVDGIIGGVGGVIVFLPNILLLFLAIAFLEDTGYMARAAFIMDRLMHKIGLHGKSFIPMLTGFGCSIPAILATRTLETRRDRLTTMLVVPLMSCGARLPIYALIIPAFFPSAWNAPVLWSIYIIGIVLAVALAKLLRVTLFRGQSTPFLMELPPYRMPTVKGLLIHMWGRSWLYLRKAGTIILGVSIVLWALSAFPKKARFEKDYDALADRAAADFVADAASLNADLALPAGSTLVPDAMRAEMALAEARENYWPDEAGYREAADAHETAMATLTAAEGGATLTALLRARDGIVEARLAFEQAVAADELEEGTPAYDRAAERRDEAIAALARQDPVAHAAAVRFLDEIYAPFARYLTRQDHEKQAEQLSYSIVGRMGRGLAPVLRPLGFDWRIATGLIGALAAKEVFVAQLGIVYSVGETGEGSEALRRRLQADYSPLVGYCIMLFCLISAPCIATVAVTRRESGAWRWALLQWVGLAVVAYVVTLTVYQVGRLFA